MTPFDEQGLDYVRVGVAKINPADDIGTAIIKSLEDQSDSASSSIFVVILILVCLVGASIYIVLKDRSIESKDQNDAMQYQQIYKDEALNNEIGGKKIIFQQRNFAENINIYGLNEQKVQVNKEGTEDLKKSGGLLTRE